MLLVDCPCGQYAQLMYVVALFLDDCVAVGYATKRRIVAAQPVFRHSPQQMKTS